MVSQFVCMSNSSKQVVHKKKKQNWLNATLYSANPLFINTVLREEDHFTRSPWLLHNQYARGNDLPGVWFLEKIRAQLWYTGAT